MRRVPVPHRRASTVTQEQPPTGTPCIVDECEHPASVYVDITDGRAVDGDTAVGMCDEHASHWRDGAE